jgi:hypothetical protein
MIKRQRRVKKTSASSVAVLEQVNISLVATYSWVAKFISPLNSLQGSVHNGAG